MKILLPALRATILTLVVTGLLYPLVVTGLAQAMFPRQANGSFVVDHAGHTVGSELIGQGFTRDAYFWGRASAAGWDASASTGSNLSTTSKKLRDRVRADVARLGSSVPDDLVTTSGSGLDPEISPAAAQWQISRVAKARAVEEARVREIVDAQIEGRTLGVLGEPRVNVLLLDLALDRQLGAP